MLNPSTKIYIYVAGIEMDLEVSGPRGQSAGSYSVRFKKGYEHGYITLTLQQIIEWTKARNVYDHYKQHIEPINPKADFPTLVDLIRLGPIPLTFLQTLVMHNEVLLLPELETSMDREDGLSIQTDGMGIAALSEERLEELLVEHMDDWIEQCNTEISSYDWDPY